MKKSLSVRKNRAKISSPHSRNPNKDFSSSLPKHIYQKQNHPSVTNNPPAQNQ